MLNEKSDVYSFGILIMEIITGRNPVDYSRPQGEVSIHIYIVLIIPIYYVPFCLWTNVENNQIIAGEFG